jgi:hypothetical protein
MLDTDSQTGLRVVCLAYLRVSQARPIHTYYTMVYSLLVLLFSSFELSSRD